MQQKFYTTEGRATSSLWVCTGVKAWSPEEGNRGKKKKNPKTSKMEEKQEAI